MGQLLNVIRAIDAIAADIGDNVSIGKYSTFKYAKPQGVTPEHCPLLAVYLDPVRHELIASEATYEMRAPVVLAYYRSAAESVETGGAGDDRMVRELAELDDLIIDRLKELSRGIPNMTEIYATLRTTRIAVEPGEVWVVRHDLEVQQ